MKLKLQKKVAFCWGIFFVALTVLGIIFLPNPSGGEKVIALTITSAGAILFMMEAFGIKIIEEETDVRF